LDSTANSDLVPGPEELAVISNQFARFSGVCRTFAPMYRQVTIPALRSGMAGKPMAGIDRNIGYSDVLAAWQHYLANDNSGRGVILIGHSQGSGVLKRLIAEQIDGKPIQAKLIGAYLIGTNVLVPKGATVGGDFKTIPTCTRTAQVGCLVSYVSFRDSAPPPNASRFGRTDQPAMAVACVNPAAPSSRRAVPLDAYLTNQASVSSSQLPPKAWSKKGAVSTPYVQVPGLLSGQCVDEGGAQFLKVHVNRQPSDPRTDEISGDVVADGQVLRDWGLHVIDVNLAMGNLINLARNQIQAYRARR
jgi:hypothetical protein